MALSSTPLFQPTNYKTNACKEIAASYLFQVLLSGKGPPTINVKQIKLLWLLELSCGAAKKSCWNNLENPADGSFSWLLKP